MKKVVVRRFDRETLAGFVSPHAWLQAGGIELMRPDGELLNIAYGDIKSVTFVKEFDGSAPAGKAFLTRPKMEGLWVRMTFRDHDSLEGILPNNLLQIETFGYTVTPPEPYSNNQRVFVPRQALSEIQVLGVVGSPLRLPRTKKKAIDQQIGLFES